MYFADEDRQADRVGQYIAEYCGDRLIIIKLRGHQTFLNNSITKPFKGVLQVCIRECKTKVSLIKCLDSFPNLRRLELDYTAVDQTAIQVHFPHLNHLLLRIGPKYTTNEEAAQILQSNKHLQILRISSDSVMTFSELSDMITEHSSISILDVISAEEIIVNMTMTELVRLAREHPLIEKLHLPIYRIPVDGIIDVLGQLKSLKILSCKVIDRFEFDRIMSQVGNAKLYKAESYDNNHVYITFNR